MTCSRLRGADAGSYGDSYRDIVDLLAMHSAKYRASPAKRTSGCRGEDVGVPHVYGELALPPAPRHRAARDLRHDLVRPERERQQKFRAERLDRRDGAFDDRRRG